MEGVACVAVTVDQSEDGGGVDSSQVERSLDRGQATVEKGSQLV